MELEIYNAFVKAGVSELATRGDLAEMENRLLRALSEMKRWTLGSIFAAVALFATNYY